VPREGTHDVALSAAPASLSVASASSFFCLSPFPRSSPRAALSFAFCRSARALFSDTLSVDMVSSWPRRTEGGAPFASVSSLRIAASASRCSLLASEFIDLSSSGDAFPPMRAATCESFLIPASAVSRLSSKDDMVPARARARAPRGRARMES
jgi:hypothetical protein